MTFSHNREQEFLTEVQLARALLAQFKTQMQTKVRLSTSREAELSEFYNRFDRHLGEIERNCHHNLKG